MIPDAVAAAIQGYLDANPAAEHSQLGRLVARELRREGWSVQAPVTGRPTGIAVDGPSRPHGAPEAAAAPS